MPILLQYDGIPGESKIKGFEKYIEVNSFEFGLGRRIASGVNSVREGSVVNMSEVVVKKSTDGATIKLFEAACNGPLDKTVKISFVRTGTGDPQEFMGVYLKATGVSGLSFKAAGGSGVDSRPGETLHLNFGEIEVKYNPIGDDLTGSPSSANWKLSSMTK